MKASYYNIAAPAYDGEKTILYNTLSGSTALLSSEEHKAYERIVKNPDFAHGEDEAFANELAQAGFLVDDPQDEVEYLRYQFERYKFNTRVFELYITPTLDCNFSCVYCYEHKRKGRMNIEVENAVVAFVQEKFESLQYKELKIVWYGGEPLLCLDTIERLSKQFIAFCDEKDIDYFASIITNASLADEAVQKRLVDCKIWCAMTTADGVGEVHERTRRSRDGKPSYETIMENVEGLLDKGMCIDFRCVVERGNAESCLELARGLAKKDNVGIRFNQMRDMTDFQCNGNCGVDILPAEEHAAIVFREFMQRNPERKDFERALRPIHLHCSTPVDCKYDIDELGNAYACSSVVGMDDYVLFNITEPPETRKINQQLIAKYGNQNPLDYEQCATCSVLPLCQGGCTRDRMAGKVSCAPIKYMIDDLLTAYSKCIDDDTAAEMHR